MDVTTAAARALGARYRPTGRVLGTGGMGQVLEANDDALHRCVAVKVLSEHLAADPEVRRRFEHEARAAAALNHPNVVAVYDVGHDADPPFIVMELLPGRTLADEIAIGPIEQHIVQRVGLEMLSALEHAHAAGIIHRDIKPGNVLIDTSGTVKVADFGIAKSLGADLTRTRELLGTPCYLAPEILAGSSASPQTDVYAVGVTLYEMLTGRKPFDAQTPWATLAAIQRGERPPLREVLPSVEQLLEHAIERAMAPDPARRFASAAEMARALAASRVGEHAGTRRTAPPPPPIETMPIAPPPPITPPPVAPASRGRTIDLDQVAAAPDPTRRLELGDETMDLGRAPIAAPRPWIDRRIAALIGAVLAGVLALVALIAAATADDDTADPVEPVRRAQPAAETDLSNDTQLERALERLREAVRP